MKKIEENKLSQFGKVKQPKRPIEENRLFLEKLKQMENKKFSNLQEFIMILDTL